MRRRRRFRRQRPIIDAEALRSRYRIEEAIGRHFAVVGRGRWRRTREHDSLVLDTRQQRWFWNSRGWYGDLFDWIGREMFGSSYDPRSHFRTVLEQLSGPSGPLPRAPVARPSRLPPPPPPPLPPAVALSYHQQLGQVSAGLQYWRRELAAPGDEGLADEAIRRYWLGYCPGHRGWRGPSYTIPVFTGGKLVNVRHRLARPPGNGGKYRPEERGRGAHLFNGDILRAAWAVVLVAGEKKAIALTVRGIPAVSSTAGAAHFPHRWLPRLAHLQRVWVAFDPGEEELARRVVSTIGPRARFVPLPVKPDDFFVAGGTREDFCALLMEAGG